MVKGHHQINYFQGGSFMATFDFIKIVIISFKLQENELIVAEERLGFTFPNELRNFT